MFFPGHGWCKITVVMTSVIFRIHYVLFTVQCFDEVLSNINKVVHKPMQFMELTYFHPKTYWFGYLRTTHLPVSHNYQNCQILDAEKTLFWNGKSVPRCTVEQFVLYCICTTLFYRSQLCCVALYCKYCFIVLCYDVHLVDGNHTSHNYKRLLGCAFKPKMSEYSK